MTITVRTTQRKDAITTFSSDEDLLWQVDHDGYLWIKDEEDTIWATFQKNEWLSVERATE